MTELVILGTRPHQHDAEILSGITGIPLARSVPEGGIGIGFRPQGLELRGARDKPGRGVSLDVDRLRRELHAGGGALRRDPLLRAVGGAPAPPVGPGPGADLRRPLVEGAREGDPFAREDTARCQALLAARPLIVDATAGLCNDAFLLAAAGFRVVAFERNIGLFLVALLNNQSFQNDPLLWLAARSIDLRQGDARKELPLLEKRPDVIVLDPMFPSKRKRSALPPKPMQILRLLVGDDPDAPALLDLARSIARRRVVVKRSDDGSPLADEAPDWSVAGKTVRYDVYATHGGEAPDEGDAADPGAAEADLPTDDASP